MTHQPDKDNTTTPPTGESSNDYFLKLEEMELNTAKFEDYYKLFFDTYHKLNINEKGFFMYQLFNAIRSIGFNNGVQAMRDKVIRYIESSK